jgi:hypothetical protein
VVIGATAAEARVMPPFLFTVGGVCAGDPEELVTLTNHGTMKLRSAVARAMILLPQERDLVTIIRESEPTVLNFELIKHLAARWEEQGMSVSSE